MLAVQRLPQLGWRGAPGTFCLLRQGGARGRRARKGLPKELPRLPLSLSSLWQSLQGTFRLQRLALWELSLSFVCVRVELDVCDGGGDLPGRAPPTANSTVRSPGLTLAPRWASQGGNGAPPRAII